MIDLPLVLHIGYHKTGTTYLQRNVFNSHPQIYYLGWPWLSDEVGRFCREFKFTHDIDFDPNYFKNYFFQVIEQASKLGNNQKCQSDSKVLLLSLESLHSGPEWFGMNLLNMAMRLKKVFAPCKIILGIRNQKDYIESNYKEYVLHGGKIRFNKFLYNSFACNYCLLPKLQYDKVISLYRNFFGNDSVHVYFQERLKMNPSLELSILMDFLGVDSSVRFTHKTTYKGLSKTSVECVRLLNKLVANDYNEQYYNVGNPERRFKIERARRLFSLVLRKVEKTFFPSSNFTTRYMTYSNIDYVDEYFRDSNKNLADIVDIDIRKFGYNY